MFIQLLLQVVFLTQVLAKVHHKCGLHVTRPIFTYSDAKKVPGISVSISTYMEHREELLNLSNFTSEPIKPLPLLVYKEKDRHLTNIPDDFDNKDSWGSFGICTEEDINARICSKLNTFKVQYEDEDISNRIYNDIYVEEPHHGTYNDLNRYNSITLQSFGKYCYAYHLADNHEDAKGSKLHTYVNIDGFSLWEVISQNLTQYYGRAIQLVISFCLLLFIWFTKSKNINESTREVDFQYRTPFVYCLITLSISTILSIIHLILLDAKIRSYFIQFEEQSFFERHCWRLIQFLESFESLFNLFLYACVFQFANLDKFGWRINYQKNKFTKILPFLLLFSFVVKYFIINLIFSLVDFFYRGNKHGIPDNVGEILYHGVNLVEFSIFGTIWYIIYKVSQEALNELYNGINYANKFNNDYADRFNSTRIWFVSAIFIMRSIQAIFYNFDEILGISRGYIQTIFNYQQTSGILENFALFCLKFLLCVLREYMLFAIPILSIIILKVWWTYDTRSNGDPSIELTGLRLYTF